MYFDIVSEMVSERHCCGVNLSSPALLAFEEFRLATRWPSGTVLTFVQQNHDIPVYLTGSSRISLMVDDQSRFYRNNANVVMTNHEMVHDG